MPLRTNKCSVRDLEFLFKPIEWQNRDSIVSPLELREGFACGWTDVIVGTVGIQGGRRINGNAQSILRLMGPVADRTVSHGGPIRFL